MHSAHARACALPLSHARIHCTGVARVHVAAAAAAAAAAWRSHMPQVIRWPHGYDPPGQVMNSTAAPYVPIVLSRGVVSVTAADNAFDTSQWLAVALVLLLDAATLLLATALFLTPLEKQYAIVHCAAVAAVFAVPGVG
eukprot:9149-Heterococcus_DN1.PRE.2